MARRPAPTPPRFGENAKDADDQRARPSARPSGDRDAEDRRAFEAAMAGARPVDRSRVRLPLPPAPRAPGARPASRVIAPARSSERTDQPGGGSSAKDRVVETSGETVCIAASGIDKRSLRELRGEREGPALTLDLHGQRREPALRSLELFLARARAAGKRRVLIIHGRGLRSGQPGPVLRQAVLESLAHGACAPLVLAAVSAAPRLGGPGATMVLLRK